MAKITWTRTDEAPLLATYSLKPIVEAFASTAGIDVETRALAQVVAVGIGHRLAALDAPAQLRPLRAPRRAHRVRRHRGELACRRVEHRRVPDLRRLENTLAALPPSATTVLAVRSLGAKRLPGHVRAAIGPRTRAHHEHGGLGHVVPRPHGTGGGGGGGV